MKLGHIIAMGGGGFSMEPDNLALDRYILSQAEKPRPKVCFIPTASAESPDYIFCFYSAFKKLPCEPSHLSLFRLPSADLESFILDKDILYVGGGNTRTMLAVWREWGLDVSLRKAVSHGVILAGLSAGAICWFEQGVTDSVPGQMNVLECLGLLGGSCCPHYDGEKSRRPGYHQLLAEDRIAAGYGLDDGAALHFLNGKILRKISSRPKARIFHVRKHNGKIIEVELQPDYLG